LCRLCFIAVALGVDIQRRGCVSGAGWSARSSVPLSLCSPPIAEAVPQVVKSKTMPIRNLDARLSELPAADGLQQRRREIAARDPPPSATGI